MKTAIEWLVTEIAMKNNDINFDFWGAVEQAKEMEKQQIIDAVEFGNRIGYDEHRLTCIQDEDEKYYNKIFKNK